MDGCGDGGANGNRLGIASGVYPNAAVAELRLQYLGD
jgi:hypothetical protein